MKALIITLLFLISATVSFGQTNEKELANEILKVVKSADVDVLKTMLADLETFKSVAKGMIPDADIENAYKQTMEQQPGTLTTINQKMKEACGDDYALTETKVTPLPNGDISFLMIKISCGESWKSFAALVGLVNDKYVLIALASR